MGFRATGSNYSRGTSSNDGGGIVGLLFLAGFGIGLWVLVCAAQVAIGALGVALLSLGGDLPQEVISNMILNGLAGAFAGIAVVLFRNRVSRSSRVGESFIAALFNTQLASPFGKEYFEKVAIGAIVGFLMGGVSGAAGFITLPSSLVGATHWSIGAASSPLAVLAGGGFGGAGSDGLMALVFLALVIICVLILLGCVWGLGVHGLLIALGGVAKATVKAAVKRALEDQSPNEPRQADAGMGALLKSGLARGAFIGAVSGVIQSVFTTIAVAANK